MRKATKAPSRTKRSSASAATKPRSKQRVRHTILGAPRWVVISVIVVIVFVFLYDPCKNLYHAKRDGDILQQEKVLGEAANQEAQVTVDTLQSEQGIQDEARLHGYVGKGETPVTVDGLGDSGNSNSVSSVPQDTRSEVLAKPEPFYITLADFFFGYNKQEAP